MFTIRGILHPTDFSATSGEAFKFAHRLASDYKVPLYVLHVSTALDSIKGENLSSEHPEQYLQKQWEKLEAIRSSEVEIRRSLEEGVPAEKIVEAARSLPCDVIVMGTHGRSGWRRIALGSVAEDVVRQAPCPVVTVKAPEQTTVRASPA